MGNDRHLIMVNCVLCGERDLEDHNQHSLRTPLFSGEHNKCCSACNHAMILITMGWMRNNKTDEEKFNELMKACSCGWSCCCDPCPNKGTHLCMLCQRTMCSAHNTANEPYRMPTCSKCQH